MKVLFATDGSANASKAARFLMSMKFDQPLEVILLTVSYDPQSANPNSIQPWFPEWIAEEAKRVEEDHDRLETLLSDRCSSVTRMRRSGDASRVILDEAVQNDVDLIVMGARGHSLLDRLLLGCVSDNVATHAPCSVLVVRPNHREDAGEVPPNKIMVAYDGSAPSKVAISELLDLDWSQQTDTTLYSVAPIFDMLWGEGLSAAAIENQEEVFKSMKEAGKTIAKEVESLLPKTRSLVEQHSHTGDAIVTQADKDDTDLIVLGDAGHGLLHEIFLGSTTKFVLRHAPCSVWISRHHRVAKEVKLPAVSQSQTQ